MKQTLLEIEAACLEGRESPEELGAIIERHIPDDLAARARYFRQMGEYLGACVTGGPLVLELWTPPD